MESQVGHRVADSPAGPEPGRADAAENLRLLRHYEPVLRFTRGELFLPMSVEDYLTECSLWRPASSGGARGRRRAAERLGAPGELTPGRLAQIGAASGHELSLRFAERSLDRHEFRAWRREAGRARLAPGSSRFAAVGLLGRLIDAVLRLSLLLRGRVPGGTAAAAEQQYRAHAKPDSCPYYGRVTRDRGFIALQYWFFYAMNDWRSTFGGVNDHEADWEQVTIFLPDAPDPPRATDPPDAPDTADLPDTTNPPDAPDRPAWVAFSSHDEAGDDLRRRPDDPDLTWQGTHPVVFAGAGSHSGAYLAGDYLITVEPPALRRLLGALRRLGHLFLPWTRAQAAAAFGIPFIDYRRGDGPGVGSGESMQWRPVLVDDETPWLRDYRGLWGLDTGDPFGGERAPAGPRYERGGSVRLCWSDPVGWAGLDKEAPSPAVLAQAMRDRIADLDGQLAVAAAEIDVRGDELRRVRAGIRALGSGATRADRARLAGLATEVEQARVRRQALDREREALTGAAERGVPPEEPHAHLRHRALPNVDPARSRHRVLRAWSAVSASVLLAGLAVVILGHLGALVPAFGALAAVMLLAEAFARGHLVQFIAGLLAVIVVAAAVGLAFYAAVGHWRLVIAVLLILAALGLLCANTRDFFRRR